MTNIKSVKPMPKAQTYDLEVDHCDHQYYLSNGMLSSNSHAVLYSMTSYQAAYLKKNFPIEFLVANLKSEVASNVKASKDNIIKIKGEIRGKKVKIVPPDVNTSHLSWKIENEKTLMTGLDSLKYMGEDAIPEIIRKRPFKDYKDLITRTSPKSVRSPSIQAMAASGSLDSFGMDRKSMFHYASDFRAKLKAYMARLDRAWERKWIKEEGLTKNEDTDGRIYWTDTEGTVVSRKVPEANRVKHMESFEYPFPEHTPWTIQEQFALEDFYMGEGISGDIFDRYPKFFDKNQSVPFQALKELFPFQQIHDDDRLNRKANSHYLGNENLRPMEAVILSIFSFTVKKEDSPIFGQEMARLTIQDPWGEDAVMLCFPNSWEAMKVRIEKELSRGKQNIEPGLAISFLGTFQWENDSTISFILGDILKYKAPPQMPEDRASKKVKMPKATKISVEEILDMSKDEMLENLEDEVLDNGMGTVNDEELLSIEEKL